MKEVETMMAIVVIQKTLTMKIVITQTTIIVDTKDLEMMTLILILGKDIIMELQTTETNIWARINR